MSAKIFVVVVAAQAEEFVTWDLEALGLVAWTPVALKWRRLASRKVTVRQPVMPGYVFLWSSDIAHDFERIRSEAEATHPGLRRVIGLLGRDGVPQPAEARNVAALLAGQTWGLFDNTLTRKLKCSLSQRVRIVGGMWQGRVGVVTKLLVKDGSEVKVHLEGAGVAGDVRLKSDKLEVLTASAKQ